jgi:hypothetical protein
MPASLVKNSCHIVEGFYIVACLLKARILKPAEAAIARLWQCKHAMTQ